MANNLTFEQAATVLNAVMAQATGAAETPAPIDTGSFVAVATTALQQGYDPLMTAISQVLSRTIFSVRPYSAKFKGLMADSIRYGNHVRKITPIDHAAEDSKVYGLTDGQSIDQYVVHKPKTVQTNIYGGNVWQDCITRYTNQIDSAFSGPDEFARFWSSIITEMTNKREQQNEVMARMTVANFIAGKLAGDTSNCIHLLTEYNTLTGLNLTKSTVYQPANFAPFMRWVYSRVAQLSELLTERSIKFHTNLTDSSGDILIKRHTPYASQKMYMASSLKFNIESLVLADTRNEQYLRMIDSEPVAFWQSIDDPLHIEVKESYLNPDGTVHVNTGTPTENDDVVGVIFDEEAAGFTVIDDSLLATPVNARGKYTNLWWSANYRWWNDFTENGIVLLLN